MYAPPPQHGALMGDNGDMQCSSYHLHHIWGTLGMTIAPPSPFLSLCRVKKSKKNLYSNYRTLHTDKKIRHMIHKRIHLVHCSLKHSHIHHETKYYSHRMQSTIELHLLPHTKLGRHHRGKGFLLLVSAALLAPHLRFSVIVCRCFSHISTSSLGRRHFDAINFSSFSGGSDPNLEKNSFN